MTVDTSIYNNAGLSTYEGSKPQKETGVSTIDQAGFLRLMTTQLQYQDPFEPTDNNQMVQQMATFTSLENQSSGNKLLTSINEALSGSRMSDAAAWIGKSMLVDSNVATPDAYGTYSGELTLDSAATNLSISLIDADGNVAKTIDLGARPAGATAFFWDGKDEEGNYVAGGPLQVKVRGASPTQITTWATIAAVQSPSNGADAKLITPLGNFMPADALRLG